MREQVYGLAIKCMYSQRNWESIQGLNGAQYTLSATQSKLKT